MQEAAYFEFYDQYVEFVKADAPNKDGFTACRCPFTDNHTTGDRDASAGVDTTSGVFNCFKCGTLGPERFLIRCIPSLTFVQATSIVDEYRRNNNVIEKVETFVKTRIRNPRWERLYDTAQSDLSNVQLALDYAEGRNLEIQTLHDLGVRFIPGRNLTHWNHDSLVFPYFVSGVLYGLRYRNSHGSKGGEKGCHFTLWGIDDLDAVSDDITTAVVVEGESDRLRTYQELKRIGFPAIVVSAPTSAFPLEWAREFDGFSKVIAIPQADDASVKFVKGFREALKERAEVLQLPWKRKQVGKDVCDWLNYNDPVDLGVHIETLAGDTGKKFLRGFEFAITAEGSRKPLINKLMYERQVLVMGGPPKNMKTWLMLAAMRAMVTGEEFAGIPGLDGKGGMNVLLIEEEGEDKELKERLDTVFGKGGWENNVVVAHHMGVKFDSDSWVDRLDREIKKNDIGCVFGDPMQRLHTSDEDSASEMGKLWANVHRLTTKYKHLGIFFLHHFTKQGDINLGWNALRGSSRTAGEADVGIFVEKRPKSEGLGVRVKFDGRTVSNLETPDGKDLFRFTFRSDRGLVFDPGLVAVDRRSAFYLEVLDRHEWTVNEAATFLGTSTVTVRNWVEKEPELIMSIANPGKPTIIRWIGPDEYRPAPNE